MSIEALLSKDQLERAAFFSACESKEHLRLWVKRYLDLDFPDSIVCDDDTRHDPSNSSPADLMWEVYSKGMDGNDPDFSRVIAYASRDGYKCVQKGTMIKTENGLAPIENVKVGDVVWTGWNWKRVTAHHYEGFKDGVRIEVDAKENPVLVTSPVHMIWTIAFKSFTPGAEFKSWFRVGDLAPGDIVKHYDTSVRVVSVERVESAEFYDLTVEDEPSYWSNGFVSHNTLVASALEIMAIFHMRRSVGHMAAITSQAAKASAYCKKMCKRPVLRDFLVGDNERTIQVQWYETADRKLFFSPAEFKELQAAGREDITRKLTERSYKIEIVVATMAGANCVDENAEITLSNRTKILAKDVKVGDSVSCFDYTICKNRITYVTSVTKGAKRGVLVTTGSGGNLKLTDDHRIFTQRGWVYAGALRLGDRLLTENQSKNNTQEWGAGKQKQISFLDVPDHLNFGFCYVCDKKINAQPEHLIVCADCDEDYDLELDMLNALNDFVVSVERCGELNTIDIGTDPTTPEKQNFFANGINVHNSLHVPYLCIDEADLIPPKPYKEAKAIPSQGEKGELPIVFITSTRKFAGGQVQREIDAAEETNTKVRHWNFIDVTEACPPSKHLPDQPKRPLYIDEGSLRVVNQATFDTFSEKEQSAYVKQDGYAGCETCPLFPGCLGRLATKQKSKSNLLKRIPLAVNQFRTFATEPELAKAQLYCWKPESTGLIYPRLSEAHLKTAAEMAEMITGNRYNPNFTKDQLLSLIKENGAKVSAGLDWGFRHAFAVVVGAIWGRRIFIIHAMQRQGLEVIEKIEACDREIRHLNPIIYPDPEDPSSAKTFRKAGYRMVQFKKDVQLGIDCIRAKVTPATAAEPEVFFLKDDPGVLAAFQALSRHRFKTDAADNILPEPNEEPEKDVSDATRYLFQNEFGKDLGKTHKQEEPKNDLPGQQAAQTVYKNWMQDEIKSSISTNSDGSQTPQVSVKKGKFFFG